jgi:hypothetical protein
LGSAVDQALRDAASAVSRHPAQTQPGGEILANKRKDMKIKGSKIAFFYFHLLFGIGTFQRVTAEKNNKFPPASRLTRKLWPATMSNSRNLSPPGRGAARVDSTDSNHHGHGF